MLTTKKKKTERLTQPRQPRQEGQTFSMEGGGARRASLSCTVAKGESSARVG
jgi:hypothetical protein